MAIQNVVLVGADGKLGPTILSHLVASNFTVTVFKRQSSKSPSNYPPGVKVELVPDAFPVSALTPLLQGQDAIIVTTAGSQTDLQKRLADAAAAAGVQRFIPADFGSCDSSAPRTQQLVPLYVRKTELREHLTALAATNDRFTWSALVVGHFFDWSVAFLHLYPAERRAEVLDGGETRFSISTLAQVARATVAMLRRPAETRNRVLFVQSFNVTQNEIVAAFERATGAKWDVKQVESEAYVRHKKVEADAGDAEAVEDLVWVLGTLDANWETRDAFAMELLGLQNEDLDAAVRAVLEEPST